MVNKVEDTKALQDFATMIMEARLRAMQEALADWQAGKQTTAATWQTINDIKEAK